MASDSPTEPPGIGSVQPDPSYVGRRTLRCNIGPQAGRNTQSRMSANWATV